MHIYNLLFKVLFFKFFQAEKPFFNALNLTECAGQVIFSAKRRFYDALWNSFAGE